MIKSITYSQNLLVDNKLVKKLVLMSTIDPKDTVLEIGAGKGIITKELLKKQVVWWYLKSTKSLLISLNQFLIINL